MTAEGRACLSHQWRRVNPMPHPGQVQLTTTAYGPDNCEDRLDEHIAALLARPSGWLIYNLHGMDEEGWGPIRAEHQNELLERITRIESIAILPVGKALSIKE